MTRARDASLARPADDVTAFELSRLGGVTPAQLRREDRRIIRLGGGLPPDDPPAIGGSIADGTTVAQILGHLESRGEIRNRAAAGVVPEPPDQAAPFDEHRAMQYLANAGLATITAAGAPVPTTDGSLSNDDDSAGAWVRFPTGSTLGTNAGLSSAFGLVWSAWEPTLIVRLRMGSDITSVRVWVGLTSGSLDGSSDPAGHRAAFRYDSTLDTNWRCSVKAGGSPNNEDSGVVVNSSAIYTLRIDLRPGHALFAIDDAPVADMTTNLPSTTQPLGVQVRVRNLAAANKFVRFGRVALLHR